ncbi:putative Type 11 methyltransferase [Magnetofaba australis IT-1]|uniref:Putative Type 11 methyltransferase n=2 Tax=Magnetofaba TaxID=1472292 RepID=A0A1Y2K2H3_9PROT|nr:putative Type 11 methyltransferase [Magnetofaba australis IT-1]
MAHFERLTAARTIQGRVLEVGAVPSDESLLCMKALSGATEKVGVNLLGPWEYADIHFIQANGNAMPMLEDASFDAVFCNATLHHDRYFWKTISEMKRVLKPGGRLFIGAPVYRERRGLWFRILRRIPLARDLTFTFAVHRCPKDYYRFGLDAVREVFMEGMEQVEICDVMTPPRMIAIGVKPLSAPTD